MGKIKIRDEQKGLIFIALIILTGIALSIVFALSLKTNTVEDALKENGIMRTLFVVEDEDSSMLFSSVLIYNPTSKKAALVNLPGYTGAIYQSLGRVDKLQKVYSEAGIVPFRNEVEKLLGMTIPYYAILTLDSFIKITLRNAECITNIQNFNLIANPRRSGIDGTKNNQKTGSSCCPDHLPLHLLYPSGFKKLAAGRTRLESPRRS